MKSTTEVSFPSDDEPQEPPESDQFPPDVVNYAKTHNITSEQAAAVKKARTGQ